VAYWQETGPLRDECVRPLGALVCGRSALERLTPHQQGQVAFLLECAVRGKVAPRTLEGLLAQLAERDDRRAAAAALRGRLVEKAN
jgi:hypothetical protein